ncbi:MAG: emp24/gp25L/p24 family protein [archaeon]|nr:emp24/gp25L/p24 family protein [archaeon]
MIDLYLLIFLYLFSVYNTMNILIPKGSNRCISKYYRKDELISFRYESLGYINERYKTELTYENKERIWYSHDRRYGASKIMSKKDGNYFLCFYSSSSKDMTISFNIGEEAEETIVNIDSIDSLNNAIGVFGNTLNNIDQDIKSGGANRESYAYKAKQIKFRISFTTILKIIFLIIFSGFQIYMVTSVVQKVKVVNKIEMKKKNKNEESAFL